MGESLRLLRQQVSMPVIEQLHEYLLKIRDEVLPKSEAGKAIAYAMKNWTALTRYCDNGDLSIDNNHTERSLRGIAVGRNNWLFVGSDRGGKTTGGFDIDEFFEHDNALLSRKIAQQAQLSRNREPFPLLLLAAHAGVHDCVRALC